MSKEVQNLFSVVLIIFVIFVFSNRGKAQVSTENIKKSSSKIQEDNVAYYKTGSLPTKREIIEVSANVRKFVWEHWKDKKDGTVTREEINRHGEKYTSIFEIKCFKEKSCKIFVNLKRENAGRGGIKPANSIEYVKYVASSIDRIENPTDYYYSGEAKLISDDAEKGADRYFVRLKDEKGKTIALL